MNDRAFPFLRTNVREPKPRTRGITEIRGPYYTPIGPRYLEDVLETMGAYVDSLKFAGGSFTLMPANALRGLIDVAHKHDVTVSTGGFIEYVLTQGAAAVDRYIRTCKEVGFDIVEISSGFITIPTDDWVSLVKLVQRVGLEAKPEVGIQFGAGGASAAAALEAEGTRDVNWAISQATRFIEAGASMIMIESEGITESVKTWRTDVAAQIIDTLGLEKVMSRRPIPRSSRGTSRIMALRSMCSWITARSFSSSASARASGARRASGAESLHIGSHNRNASRSNGPRPAYRGLVLAVEFALVSRLLRATRS